MFSYAGDCWIGAWAGCPPTLRGPNLFCLPHSCISCIGRKRHFVRAPPPVPSFDCWSGKSVTDFLHALRSVQSAVPLFWTDRPRGGLGIEFYRQSPMCPVLTRSIITCP